MAHFVVHRTGCPSIEHHTQPPWETCAPTERWDKIKPPHSHSSASSCKRAQTNHFRKQSVVVVEKLVRRPADRQSDHRTDRHIGERERSLPKPTDGPGVCRRQEFISYYPRPPATTCACVCVLAYVCQRVLPCAYNTLVHLLMHCSFCALLLLLLRLLKRRLQCLHR